MDGNTVQREARQIASDARQTRDLSDGEAEVLGELLQSDEAFGHLVTAQQNAVAVDANQHDIDKDIESLAREGATPLGNAIDHLVKCRVTEAKEIHGLTDHEQVDGDLSWKDAWELYDAGYTSVGDLQEADQADLIDAGIPRSTAARVKASVDGVEDGDA